MQKRILVERRKTLPKTPGVYLFCDGRKQVLYIGKATQLRSRVASYFNGHDSRGERIASMIAKIKSISYVETDTVLEAVILEANLIRKLKPKYNVDLKDDKSFSYIAVTKDDFPRFVFVRERELGEATSLQMRGGGRYSDRRGVGRRSEKTLLIRPAGAFPSAKGKGVGVFRRVYGPYTSKRQAGMVLKILRKLFPFHSAKQNSEKGCLYAQIGLCPAPYDGKITKGAYRKNIRNIEYVLRGQKKRLITTLEKEMKALAKNGKYEEAAKKRDEVFALRHIRDIALLGERIADNGQRITGRVECYDISHISGESPVASMVVFEEGEPKPSEYRKFAIKYVQGINDVGMMREVLARRLRHEEWPRPEAIVLDGGQGHVNMAEKLLGDLGIEGVTILGVAKGPTRKKVDTYPSRKFPPPKILLQDRDILEKLREEAHRFALSYHRKKRKKSFLR